MSRGTLLVTGASGFLGSAVVEQALADSWQVRVLARSPWARPSGVEVVQGSLNDPDALGRACAGVQGVVHAAGLAHVFGAEAANLARFTEVNETGTANMVRAAVQAAVPRIVLASSVSVYGASADSGSCDESTPCLPRSPYAISKLGSEERARELVTGTNQQLAILRFATIYGPGDRGNVAKLVAALRTGRFVWPGSGANRKSLIDRSDAARACLVALDAMPLGISVFNVSASAVTMQQIVECICTGLGRPVPRLRIPQGLLEGAAAVGRGIGDPGGLARRIATFLHDDVYPGDAFERHCGFVPVVSLQEGLRKQVQAQPGTQPG